MYYEDITKVSREYYPGINGGVWIYFSINSHQFPTEP